MSTHEFVQIRTKMLRMACIKCQCCKSAVLTKTMNERKKNINETTADAEHKTKLFEGKRQTRTTNSTKHRRSQCETERK